MNIFKNTQVKPIAWIHESGICLLPYLGFQWYKTELPGCLRFQINFGWLIFSCALQWSIKK